ncbi:mechanosensitive ion channel family protein [Candidatus Woesearchaeota archaeon]|nr:mechanosensitive ion channel family protein [Candidatus Woesearchaeota archaeon]
MAFDYGQVLGYTFLGNTGKDYLMALAVFLGVLIVLKIFKSYGILQLKKIAKRSKTPIDDLVIKVFDEIHWPFYVLVAAYLAERLLSLTPLLQKLIAYAILIIGAYYVVRGLQDVVDYLGERLIERKKKQEKIAPIAAVQLICSIVKALLWVVAIIFIIANLGFDVTSLVAGLGIGGIAIALALQNVLSDVFSSFSISFDKPFEIGDFIIVGEHMGTVKQIGIKSTRIKALQGEEIVISNRELTSTRIQNFKRMERRRVVFKFGITYSTPVKKMKKIPAMVGEIFKKVKLADLDRVHFKEYGDFSLNYEVVYYVNTSDYNKYMDTQQEVNLDLKETFEKEGIEFAYPTQTIFLNK